MSKWCYESREYLLERIITDTSLGEGESEKVDWCWMEPCKFRSHIMLKPSLQYLHQVMVSPRLEHSLGVSCGQRTCMYKCLPISRYYARPLHSNPARWVFFLFLFTGGKISTEWWNRWARIWNQIYMTFFSMMSQLMTSPQTQTSKFMKERMDLSV